MVSTRSSRPRASEKKEPREGQALPARPYDWGLVTVVSALLLLGLLMVLSAGFPKALEVGSSPYSFALRQLQWIPVGVAALIVAARIPYTVWERSSIPIMAIALLGLIAVLVIGDDRYGARRTLFNGSIQPSEPAKVALLIYISAWLASKGERIRDISYGLVPFGVLMGGVAGLIVAEPDISTTVILVAAGGLVFFLAGADMRQILLGGAIAALTLFLLIYYNGHAQARLESYLASYRDPLQSTEQQIAQGAQALTEGGPLGVGLGQGQAKYPARLPLAWSDNIFAVIGEELGLLGGLLVIGLYGLFAHRGFRIASQAGDMFGALLAAGITCLVLIQALVHMAVAVALAPPTGVPLPFISLGGSSLVTMLGATGMLLSIGRYGHVPVGRSSSGPRMAHAHFDLRWRHRRSRVPRAGRGRKAPARSRARRRVR